MTRVLIVDDNDQNLYYMTILLRGHGFTVDCAANGAQALDKAQQHVPDMIISDLLMPVMDGFTLLRHWKADDRLKAVPFIVHTATYTDAEDEKLAMDLGADAFILKPAQPEDFLEQLRAVGNRPASAGQPAAHADLAVDADLLEVYNQTLVRKLEQKSQLLEEANLQLQQDIAGREIAEAALLDSEERFRLLTQATNDAVWDWNMVKGSRWWSEGFTHLFGHSHGGVADNQPSWSSLIHPDDRGRVLAELEQTVAGGGSTWHSSYRFRCRDDSWAQVEDRGHLLRDPGGKAIRMMGGLSDVSQRKELEEQVRKSQRMEAVGQLTGGIAHDFNNLLTVVLVNAECLEEQLAQDPAAQDMARMIIGAAQRGSDLTQRLLSFARKQALAPVAVDLNHLIAEMEPLLRRVLGGGIRIQIDPGPGLPPALVDAAQLEHALLNLCVNARDAMPGGGSMGIATACVELHGPLPRPDCPLDAGSYLTLSVSDTGEGIPAGDLQHLFEPFFSTKDEGKGSGLGLAMVHGFSRQSGGHVSVISEPGRGSTFMLYLPVSREAAEPPAGDQVQPSPAAGTGTILLVEDDPLVRNVAEAQLQALGYVVLVADGGERALAILAGGQAVDLLFTDLSMPGMSGQELVRRARQMRADLKVLFTSGYAGNYPDVSEQPAMAVLGKPYRRGDLARRIQDILQG